MRLADHFDEGTIERGRDYARRGFVVSVRGGGAGRLLGRVSNGRDKSYTQRISIATGFVDGMCSCPVGHNCKHVVAVLVHAEAIPETRSELSGPLAGWLHQIRRSAAVVQNRSDPRPEDYPANVKDRLLYVLAPSGPGLRIEPFKGRINAAGTEVNRSMRRYDAEHALRSAAPAKFFRPVDLDLLRALGQAGIWGTHSGHRSGMPSLLRPSHDQIIGLMRRLCETGRLLYDTAPQARLDWSGRCPEPRLAWSVDARGDQRLVFEDESGRPLALYVAEHTCLWVDRESGLIGTLASQISETVLRAVSNSPEVKAHQAPALIQALPETLGGMHLPRPHVIRENRRNARMRHPRLTLGAAATQSGPGYYDRSVELPTLTLRFVYEGQEVEAGGEDPRYVENGEIVILKRDHRWEERCAERLRTAGALEPETLEIHWPGDGMLGCDFVFADGEFNPETLEYSALEDALRFVFRTLPALRDEGWEVIESPAWPYHVSDADVELSVSTQGEEGAAFQGNDWFSLGFQAEIGGKSVDVAPLIASFLEQMRTDWDDIPDAETLSDYLAEHPVYLDLGKAGYVACDLSPLAGLLHLFLIHYAELGALHPADAGVARLVEEALSGSAVRFADHAGILPLARSLEALAAAETFETPDGLKAELREYQAYGAAWMGTLVEAGFGAVLADDMGLGKTIQTLALLLARRQTGASGPALLIVPTSLLYSWQSQAEQFAPDMRLIVLHGTGRAKLRDQALNADLVLTTYPLLARDKAWLADQNWPLVILDEAHTLKNPAAQMTKALRAIPAAGRIALTGTPLENSLQDIWTLIDWVNPGLLGDRKSFQTRFRKPIEAQGDRAAQARLNRRLHPFLLRRTKEEVAAELPAKTEIVERVELPASQQALYESVRSLMDARVREAIGIRGLASVRITVLDALLKLRQVCCDPALVKSDASRAVTESAKRARLHDLLVELVAEGRRVLVFSQFVEMLRLIEADLKKAGIPHLVLTGQTTRRSDVLEAFSQGDAPVFLLSLKAGGVGLTLTEADTVILYDPWWNPAVERQAMDRTHRIGQDKPVFVHRLVAAGTVEEKILDMQSRKQALADALFEPTSRAAPVLDEETLHDLFSPLSA